MRVVLDTDVMVAAIRSDAGASRRLLVAALQQEFTLLLSVPLVIEYQSVMARPEHLTAAGLSAAQVDTLLDAVVRVSEAVRLAFLWRPALKDPNDDMVLEVAVNGQADRLVTFNRRDYGTAAARFGIVVCTPADAVRALGARA
jgi:putative PIN family toxin of toxin-antitoxin system